MKSLYRYAFIGLCVGVFFVAHAAGFRFQVDLKYGDTSSDVTELQKILNTFPDTRVATTGAGSPGNETMYFGTLTKNAVIAFQNKFKEEILTPAGLSSGTGYVGSFTRAKLNSILDEREAGRTTNESTTQYQTSATITTTSQYSNQSQGTATTSTSSYVVATSSSSTGSTTVSASAPVLYSLYPTQAYHNDTVLLFGNKLATSSRLRVGSIFVTPTNRDYTSMVFKAPEISGTFPVFVSYLNEISNRLQITISPRPQSTQNNTTASGSNQNSNQSNSSNNSQQSSTSTQQTADTLAGVPMILFISDINVAPGTTVAVTGTGFIAGSKVYANGSEVSGVTVLSQMGIIKFKVPEKKGVLAITVKNNNGTSNSVYIVVTDKIFKTITNVAAGNNMAEVASVVEEMNDEEGGDTTNGGGILGALGMGALGGAGSSGGSSGGTTGTGGGAGGGGGSNDFYGGKINQVTYCTCYYDFGVVVEVQDLASNQTVKVKYSPYQSRLRENYNIWSSGACVIGGYNRGSAQCQNTSGYTCTSSGTTPDGTIDWIRGIGSSSGNSCNTNGGA